MYYYDDNKLIELKAMHESMQFDEAAGTVTEPQIVPRPVAPPKEAPKDVQDKYVQDLKTWMDQNAKAPVAPPKPKTPTAKMHKETVPGIASSEGSGVKLNTDALLADGQGNFWVSPHDQVLFLYRRPTDTDAGEPVLHPDERQFAHNDKIWIYRKFITPDGQLSSKGLEYYKRAQPEELEIILDNFLDKITSDKDETLPDNTLARNVVAIEDPSEPEKPLEEDKSRHRLYRP